MGVMIGSEEVRQKTTYLCLKVLELLKFHAALEEILRDCKMTHSQPCCKDDYILLDLCLGGGKRGRALGLEAGDLIKLLAFCEFSSEPKKVLLRGSEPQEKASFH